MDDLLSEFLTETSENLSTLDVELVRLEQNPNNPELLKSIFRLVHTIKGTCGFLGLPRLERVAHASENVLGRVRDGELFVTPGIVSVILQSLDRIKGILSELERTEKEPDGDDIELIDRLNAIAEGRDSGEAEAPAPAAPVAAAPPPPPVAAPAAPQASEVIIVEPPAPPAARIEAPAPAEPPKPAAKAPPSGGDDHSGLPAGEAKELASANQTIRVSVELLENLMTMVSELVLTRNQLLQIVRRHKDSEFTVPLQRLSHVTSELQEGVMKTRMQPIGNAWAKLPRLVRDLSIELHKKIELQMIGADTELDRQVLELIKDPLTHMVRNSADHGVETPEVRAAGGKSETGRITLNAYHEGGHIIIEIADDGRGLDITKIKEKVLQNNLASEADLDQMSDQQIHQFIFKAGFSTAAKVTSVSGRGVGMDVVRTNIEKIGGTIEMKSKFGRGSTFVIKIPLTLAIVSALIVESSGERFAIPQISVVELVRASANSEHRIERVHGTPVLRLRNRLLPLVNLERLLQLDVDKEASTSADAFIVVTQVGAYTFGIMVDRVFDTEEIVVKPVAPILRHLSLFSGNTILGDGSVIMILDPNGIATATGEMTMSDAPVAEQGAAQASRGDEKITLLVFRAGKGGPKAVPLSLVARLEEIDLASVEYSNAKPMVQYRDKLMPLIPIDPSIVVGTEGSAPVLVFTDGDHSMGLLVDEIVDIVEDKLKVELTSDNPGFMGSAIIAGRATDLIDAGYFLQQAFGDWFQAGAARQSAEQETRKRILVVDDSAFFRNLLTPLLSVAGYDSTAVGSASEALGLLEAGHHYDVVVSDVEMPDMNGFEFAKSIRSNSKYADMPIIALSSHSAPEDFERGRAAGFTDYVAKSDRDALIASLAQALSMSVSERGMA